MKKKPKYDWTQPSLFPDYDLHPANKELREIRTGTDKNGRVFRNAVITKSKAYYVEQARKIWGDKYDYTDSIYTHGKKPIIIYCPKHDYHFRVAMAQNHIIKPQGNRKATGCPVCAAEERHGCEYGTDWYKYLKLCAKNNRVGLIHPEPKQSHKSPEQIAAEKAEREAKAELRRREEQAYMDKWKAKNIYEAQFKERVFQMYGDQYDTALVDYKGREKPVTLICRHHGIFEITPRMLLCGIKGRKPHGCWKCEGIIPPWEKKKNHMTADMFFKQMHELYDGTELDFMTSEFKGMRKTVTAYCRRHGFVTHSASYWLEGNGCEYCNGKFYPKDFLRLAREKHGDKFYYRGIKNITSMDSEIMIHCKNPKHHWHKQRVYCHLSFGNGCVECYGQSNKWTPEERGRIFLKKAEKMFPGKFDYSEVHYVNKRTPVRIRCIEHDYWFDCKPNDHIHKRSAGCCPVCYESSGELAIRRWLMEHKIDFKKDEPIPNEDPTLPLQYLTVDFIIEYNQESIFIEFNGAQHYMEVDHFYEGGRIRTFAVQQHRDRYLRQYCHDHHHNLLEIPYTDFDRVGEILSAILLEGKTDYSTYYVNNTMSVPVS